MLYVCNQVFMYRKNGRNENSPNVLTNKPVAVEVCASGVRTFAVELEAGQLGVDAHRDRPHLVERHSQRLLVAHWDLLVAFAWGGHARRGVLARLVLDAPHMEKVQFGQKLKVYEPELVQLKLTSKENVMFWPKSSSVSSHVTHSDRLDPFYTNNLCL